MIYCRSCPAFYFCGQHFSHQQEHRAGKGRRGLRNPLSFQLEKWLLGYSFPSCYMQGSVLGAGAALHRLFFLFGPGLGLSSGAESLACETELGTSTRSSTAIKKPPVSVVSGEARRQCSAPGKVLRPRWGHEGRTGASLWRRISKDL